MVRPDLRAGSVEWPLCGTLLSFPLMVDLTASCALPTVANSERFENAAWPSEQSSSGSRNS
jgi:hypothetical protein